MVIVRLGEGVIQAWLLDATRECAQEFAQSLTLLVLFLLLRIWTSTLARQLGDWGKLPITYAGGVGSFEDLETLREAGSDRLDVTIGSALSIFGGDMDLAEVIRFLKDSGKHPESECCLS